MSFKITLPKGLSLKVGPNGTLYLSKFDYQMSLGDLSVGEIESIKHGFHMAQEHMSGEKSAVEKIEKRGN